jgi:hypothetical protein
VGWTCPLQVKLQDCLFCCGLDLSAAGKTSGRFVLLWGWTRPLHVMFRAIICADRRLFYFFFPGPVLFQTFYDTKMFFWFLYSVVH